MFTKRSDAQCLMFNHIYPHYLLQLRTWYDQAPGAPPGVYIVTLCLFIISWTPWHGLIITHAAHSYLLSPGDVKLNFMNTLL